MKKNLIALLPVILTLAVLVTGIGWLWHSLDQDQEQTFQVIESGQVEETDAPEMCDTNDEDVCLVSSPLGATP